MSDKKPFERVSATEFKNHQGNWLNRVVEGARLAIFRRGKPVAAVESPQQSLELNMPQDGLLDEDSLKKEMEELRLRMNDENADLVRRISEGLSPLDRESLELIVRISRGFVEKGFKGEK